MPLKDRIRKLTTAALRRSDAAARLYVSFQKRLGSRSQPVVFFFPGDLDTGSSGDLRAVALAHELRHLGWRAVIVPPRLNLASRREIIAREPAAILYLQQSRHPLNDPQLYPSHPSVFDADDADILGEPERIGTIVRSSAHAIAGSEFLAEQFRLYSPDVTVIWTGTYITEVPPFTRPAPPIIAWAASNPFEYQEEAAFVLELWKTLAADGIPFAVMIYTNDTPRARQWLAPLDPFAVPIIIPPRMAYRQFVESLAGVAIGLQPVCTTFAFSRGKSFGKVLAYLAARVPVIASDAVDHSLFFRDGENGILVDTLPDWIAACKRLLNSAADSNRLASAAHADMLQRLTSKRAAELLAQVLTQVTAKQTTTVSSASEGAITT
jgi:hypothetical protein